MPGRETPHEKTVAWSYDMEGHAKKCVGRSCDLANKCTEWLCKVSTRYLDDRSMWTTSKWLARSRICVPCGRSW